jgi:predicted AAA+ superfamily ATPase
MIRRNIQSRIQDALADTPVVLLNGARQTGKTTLVQSLANNLGAEYFSLDDVATLALARGDPAGFVRNLVGPVVIDEIQKAPELFPAIKLAVDRNRKAGRFLLTGSANVMVLPRLSDSLAGRMEVVPLFPFSAGEIAGIAETFIRHLFTGDFVKLKRRGSNMSLAERVVCGGYPEAVQRQDAARRSAWFSSYISTLLQRDVRDLARVDALHALPNLLKLLAARSAGLFNLADVGRDAGMPHTTLTRYLILLEALFLIHRLPAWSTNFGKRLVKSAKLHVADTGLACHLIGADVARLNQEPSLLGRIVESFVVAELRKQTSWTDPQVSLYHFRTAAGLEVDLILEKPDGSIAGVEIKARATVAPADFAALQALRDQLKKRFRSGVVLYGGDQALPFGDKLWALPMENLWAT